MIKVVIGRKNGKTNTTKELIKELIKKCKNSGDPLDCAFCKHNNSKECPLYRFRE